MSRNLLDVKMFKVLVVCYMIALKLNEAEAYSFDLHKSVYRLRACLCACDCEQVCKFVSSVCLCVCLSVVLT